MLQMENMLQMEISHDTSLVIIVVVVVVLMLLMHWFNFRKYSRMSNCKFWYTIWVLYEQWEKMRETNNSDQKACYTIYKQILDPESSCRFWRKIETQI